MVLDDSGFSTHQWGGHSRVDRKELGKIVSKKLGYMIQYTARTEVINDKPRRGGVCCDLQR